MQFDHSTESIDPNLTEVLTVVGTGAIELPIGNTAQRPIDADKGAVRFNEDIDGFEGLFADGWKSLSGSTTFGFGQIRHVNASTSVTATDYVLLTHDNNVLIELPNAALLPGKIVNIKRCGVGIPTITSVSLIDDVNTVYITATFSALTFVSDEVQWWII